MRPFLTLGFLFYSAMTFAASTILWGPVISGTTAHNTNIAFKSRSQGQSFGLILLEGEQRELQSSFGLGKAEVKMSNGVIHHFKLDRLKPDRFYSFFILGGRDTVKGSFRTFPADTSRKNFSFTFGSCNENYKDQSIFKVMDKHHPLFFLHLGDWTYPDHIPYPEGESNGKNYLYSSDYQRALAAYDVRCSLPFMKDFMQHTSIDFVYDDDDMTIDGCSRTTYTELKMVNEKCEMLEHPLADSIRMNTINAYFAAFPGYDMTHEKEAGAYHSFHCGNVEVFFLDTRANRSPDTEIFKQQKNGKWRIKIDSAHNNLGIRQYQWLLNGLKNSKADWKIIASGTNFNPGYKKVMDLAMVLQSRVLPNGMNGAFIAAMLSSTWSGYPYQQRGLLNFCSDNKIANVVMLSGDAHTAGIDDGKNSGFPECMSGNLAVDNTHQLDYVHNVFQFNIWNQGGQGIGNKNYQNTFGKVEVFGKDSLRFSIVDDLGAEISRYTVKEGFIPRRYSMRQGVKLTASGRFRSVGKILKMIANKKKIEREHLR